MTSQMRAAVTTERIPTNIDELPSGSVAEAERRMWIVHAMCDLDPKMPMMERYRAASAASGESVSTLRRWYARVKGLPFHDWAAALAPAWSGGRPPVEFSEEAWQFVVTEWGCQSQPALRPIYRRAKREAKKRGWILPSYKTVLRRINALPAAQRTLMRQGEAALDRMFPAVQRDYSTLRLHELWCSDGRKADIFCSWPDGYAGRPILMVWQELRSRKVLGWAIGKTESAELTRLSFRNASMSSRAVPEQAYLDNGRAYASKQITGGQPTRNRFKVKEDDPAGVLTIFKVKPVWATPYRGQVKPTESYWNVIAEGERCAAFAGSWCGNRPEAKPEEFNPSKLVPIEQYRQFVARQIEEKNAEPHRGDSMNGKSPDAMYAELLETTAVRRPTEKQLRLCLMAAERVPVLEKTVGLMRELARTPEERQQVDEQERSVRALRAFQGELAKLAKDTARDGLKNALNDIFTGAKSAKDALLDMVGSFAKAMLDVLNRRLAEQLVAQFERALPGGGFAGAINSVGSFFASFFHTGGVVGSSAAMGRPVPAAAFALAPRYHFGGIAGLMPGEVPLVAKVGETIRTVEQESALQARLSGAGGLGGVSIAVSVQGAEGSTSGMKAAGDSLAMTIKRVVHDWAIDQSRPGGLLRRSS